MIENVVFDLGGVLMHFNPIGFSRLFTDTEEDAELICQALFKSLNWAYLDAGAISEDAALLIAKSKLPERLHPNVEQALAEWDLKRTPIQETNDLAAKIKQAGYGVYILSNASVRFPRIVERIPCHDSIDGWMASAFEHIVKPDPEIYRRFCERFDLAPESCAFTDDNQDNITGALAAGMRAHLFRGADELEDWLRDEGLKL